MVIKRYNSAFDWNLLAMAMADTFLFAVSIYELLTDSIFKKRKFKIKNNLKQESESLKNQTELHHKPEKIFP